jgi:hypothetical protein
MAALSEDGAAPDIWAELCVRFHDLRLRAYAHRLDDRWRALVKADPQEADLLTRWQSLADEIYERDGDESSWIVRYGEDDGGKDDDGDAWWDGWTDDEPHERFVCPAGRCSRVASRGLTSPQCWLFRTEMVAAGSD